LDNPRHYRDARNNSMMERTFPVASREEIFCHTGVQFMNLNSLYQFYAMKLADSPGLKAASRLLFMPDLLNYWLTGVQKAELTVASTSQFYNPAKKRWATELLDKLGLPSSILPEIVQPGSLLGPLLPELAESSGLGAVNVYATGAHDTASAVAAVPAEGDDWCYISSGTWSLMGTEEDQPIINDKALALNFTNEVGFGGKIRLLKNIAGLWLLQECRRHWASEGNQYEYSQLAELASSAKPFAAVINPDAFLDMGHMPERIAEYCRTTGQAAPEQPGGMVRVILESLALRYRQVLESLEQLRGKPINTIHIVGGGSRNQVLNQLVADATGRRVVAGPTEATAAGNIIIQAIGAGQLEDHAAARQVIKNSFPVTVVEPKSAEGWEAAYQRFQALPKA
jgi:rhamnulokinase